MKRVKYAKEPVLHIHRYVVAIIYQTKKGCRIGYRYAVNLDEVREIRDHKRPAGAVIEVYHARHDFKEAWTN